MGRPVRSLATSAKRMTSPWRAEGFWGDSSRLATGVAITSTATVRSTFPIRADSVARPGPYAVTTPSAETAATRAALLRHFTSEGHAVVMYCTEVPEVFDVADRVHVVSDGRLSDPLLVFEYPDVKALAAAITRLERHAVRSTEAAAAPSAA